MATWPDVPYQAEPGISIPSASGPSAPEPGLVSHPIDGGHLRGLRIPSSGDTKGPVEEGRADDNMSDRLFMSPRSDLDPGSHRASSLKSALSVYADAASEVSEEVADGSFAEAAAGDGIANKEDLEEGRSRPANAASSARRRMLVPTDGGMVTRTHIVKVMAQQLSVGLWLMPYAFSKLGWAAASIAMTVSTFGSLISAALQQQLARHGASEVEVSNRERSSVTDFMGAAVGQGVLLLHDLLLATVLQLLSVQSLQQLTHWGIGDWGYGAIVAAAVLALSQVKYLTRPALVLMVAALCVAVAYAVTVGWFAGHRIPTQHAAFQDNEATTLATAGLSILFCFRIVAPAPNQRTNGAAAQDLGLWPSAAAAAFAVTAIATLGGVGYWSRGAFVQEVIVWGIENRALQRVATVAVLIQALTLYLAVVAGICDRAMLALGVSQSNEETTQAPAKGRRRVSWLAVAGWLLSAPVTVALALVTAAVRPHLIQLVALGAVAKNLCCLTVPAFTCLRKLPGRQAWYWTVAQVVVLMLSLGAVGFGSYASLTALQQQAQVATVAG